MRTAAPKDRSYLEQLNFKKLQKGKKPDGENPKLFYKQLQDEAKSGPVFNTQTLDLVEGLPELPKPVTKWIANLAVKDKLDDIKPQELGLIIDWIKGIDDGSVINTMTWDEAVKAQKEWHDTNFQVQDLGEYTGNNVIFKADGYTFVEIDNRRDLQVEGDLMGHCVGGNNYWQAVQSGETKIYSLRDSNNRPHVTMEVTDGEMKQCFGKKNETPIAKYHPALKAFFNKINLYEGYVLIGEDIPEEKISYFIEHGSKDIRQRIARTTKSENMLMSLSKDSDKYTRGYVAGNENTPVDILVLLAKDNDPIVRRYLCDNDSTPYDILEMLAQDEDKAVRNNIAANHNVSSKTLDILASDIDIEVVRRVSKNAKLPIRTLTNLAKSKDDLIRINVAQNKSTPVDVLRLLAADEHPMVRRFVATNKNTPLDTLQMLADDKSVYVRMDAESNPTYMAHELSE